MMENILDGVSPQELGENIQKARNKKGWTAAQLGERIGVSHVTILNAEKGEKLSRQTLVALAKELHDSFSVTWLQKHLSKFAPRIPDFYDSFETKIREIVQDELNKLTSKKDKETKETQASFFGKVGGTPDESDLETINTQERKKIA